jgi:hypothetical protein
MRRLNNWRHEIAALPVKEYRRVWDATPLFQAVLLTYGTEEQLASLRRSDLAHLLASDDPSTRMGAMRAVGKVGPERDPLCS